MRLVLFAATFISLFFAGARPARAEAFRTGPEANKYLFDVEATSTIMTL